MKVFRRTLMRKVHINFNMEDIMIEFLFDIVPSYADLMWLLRHNLTWVLLNGTLCLTLVAVGYVLCLLVNLKD